MADDPTADQTTAPELTLLERFENSYVPEPMSGCWLWLGTTDKAGYGRIGSPLAHRTSWQLYRGDIPPGIHVLHKCDLPCCVNPDHLFLGTNADNVADKMRKGRLPSQAGERNPNAKLTAAQVIEIRNSGGVQRVVAAKYGVTQMLVSQIRRSRVWKDVA